MAKTLNGVVVSTKMGKAAVVSVTRKIEHPKYKKVLKRDKKYIVALNNHIVKEGEFVIITETRPISKNIHFAITEIKSGKERK